MQPRLTLLAEAADPTVSALPGDPLGLGGMGHGPALDTDTLDQQLPATEVQSGITVGHQDLRLMVRALGKPHPNRRSSHDQQPRAACHDPTVTNVLAEYN